ncbi:MAG: Rid family hydrolase, partial [Candidatus Hodarchaeales archaeon]
MDKEIIATDKAPKAIGAYSQAIKVGHFVYTSGQLGVDPATGKMKETLGEQTHQVMKNLENVLT